jgi:hypothetical protein
MRKQAIINTKLDGPVPFEWWDKEDFRNRNTIIYSGESATGFVRGVPTRELVPDVVIPIPDNAVICDFCNTDIDSFPVPVMGGSYALCPKCFHNVTGLDSKEEGGKVDGS